MVPIAFARDLNPKLSTCLYVPLSIEFCTYVDVSKFAKLWYEKKCPKIALVTKHQMVIEINIIFRKENKRIFYKKLRKG